MVLYGPFSVSGLSLSEFGSKSQVSVNVSFNKRENGPRSEQRFPNDPIQSFRAGEAQANSEPNRSPPPSLCLTINIKSWQRY